MTEIVVSFKKDDNFDWTQINNPKINNIISEVKSHIRFLDSINHMINFMEYIDFLENGVRLKRCILKISDSDLLIEDIFVLLIEDEFSIDKFAVGVEFDDEIMYNNILDIISSSNPLNIKTYDHIIDIKPIINEYHINESFLIPDYLLRSDLKGCNSIGSIISVRLVEGYNIKVFIKKVSVGYKVGILSQDKAILDNLEISTTLLLLDVVLGFYERKI